MKRIFTIIGLFVAAVLASGCAATGQGLAKPTGQVYERQDQLRVGKVLGGKVLSVRPVVMAASGSAQNTATGAGTALGALAGVALAGGGNTGTKAALAIIGGLAGGAAANAAVEKSGADHYTYEIVVQLENRRKIAVVQSDYVPLAGEDVWVITVGRNTRVVAQ